MPEIPLANTNTHLDQSSTSCPDLILRDRPGRDNYLEPRPSLPNIEMSMSDRQYQTTRGILQPSSIDLTPVSYDRLHIPTDLPLAPYDRLYHPPVSPVISPTGPPLTAGLTLPGLGDNNNNETPWERGSVHVYEDMPHAYRYHSQQIGYSCKDLQQIMIRAVLTKCHNQKQSYYPVHYNYLRRDLHAIP